MTAPTPPYWAWAADGSAMHAWVLTVDQVQEAKAARTRHGTICGRDLGIGDRPTQPRHADAERNHCSDCWAILNPMPVSPFIAALVLPAIPHTDTRWRRSG